MKTRTRVVAAISACALTIGSAAPAMAHGGKHQNHNKDDKRGAKVVNIQTNVSIINQTAVAVNLGKGGTAVAQNVAYVGQSNKN